MKKLLLLIVLFSIELGAQAQAWVYQSFPGDSAKWREHSGNVSCNCCNEYQLVITGDTLVGSYTYVQLEEQGVYYDLPVNPSYWGCNAMVAYNHHYSGTSYYGAYREDTLNKRIYFLLPGQTTDTLLYDFNLSLGDTIGQTLINVLGSLGSYHNIVTSIDSVIVYGSYRKRFGISSNSSSSGEYIYLIEGIGTSNGLLAPLIPPFEGQNELLCFSLHDSLAYPSGPGICAPPVVLGIADHSDENTLRIHPNPSSGKFQIQSDSQFSSIEVRDLLGKVVFYDKTKNKSEIDLTDLNNGIYFIKIADSEENSTTKKIVKQ